MSKIIAQTGGKPMTEQEALAAIKEMKDTAYWYRGDHKMAAAIRVMENLVDRAATPKKPKLDRCPMCDTWEISIKQVGVKQKFCPKCGQAIDWSDND